MVDKWVEDKHAEVISEAEAQHGFFLPHFPVVRRDKTTTKVRIVANGKAEFKGLSLNSCMLSGPKVINVLVPVLLRFRKHEHALMVDVQSMFLRVMLPVEDRAYHRFVLSDDQGRLQYYQFVGHIFGSAGSLCIAVCVLKLAALRLSDQYPAAAEAILNGSMVDDILGSSPELNNLRSLAEGLQAITHEVGMNLHKWCSNAPAALPTGAVTVDAAEITDKADLAADGSAEYTSLGLVWKPAGDTLSFKFKSDVQPPYTKLKLLKLYMAVFDPLGLILPFIMSARILYRDLWKAGADWDTPIDANHEREWNKWIAQLPELPEKEIARSLELGPDDRLAVFSDASQDAYGAIAYVYSDKRSVAVYARGRVNSNSGRTMPVLELLGAEMAVVVARDTARALGLSFSGCAFFTDSMVVLNWLRAPNRDMSHYITRKVAQIREAVSASAWQFVPTDQNPADLLSRGCKLTELFRSDLWWGGPGFLMLSREEWPEHGIPAQPHEPLAGEAKLQSLVRIYRASGGAIKPRGESPFARVSDWTRACRIAAAIAKGARKWKAKTDKQEMPARPTAHNNSMLAAVALEQAALWPEEFHLLAAGGQLPQKHPWLQLHVIWREGCIQVYGRALQKPVPFLNKTSHLAKLWLAHVHENLLQHAGGPRTLQVEARKHIWIAGAPTAARTAVRGCAVCRTLSPDTLQQLQADLPNFRL